MSNIIQLSDYIPHLSGPAMCLECGSEWHAIAPLGTVHLDCPECERRTGVLKHSVLPEYTVHCGCDNNLFYLTPDGCVCRKCGKIQEDY